MTTPNEVTKELLQQALDALEETSRLIGATQAKKDYDAYTELDASFEAAMREDRAEHRKTIEAAIALPVEPSTVVQAKNVRRYPKCNDAGAAKPTAQLLAIPDDVRRAAKLMQQNGYRGPLAWAKNIIDFAANYTTPPPVSKIEPTAQPLTTKEIADLTAMIWGAPVDDDELKKAEFYIRAYEAILQTGERPKDPVNGGRFLDIPGAFGEDAATPPAIKVQPAAQPISWPQGLTEILREAADIINAITFEHAPANIRWPIADELDGFACMIDAQATPPPVAKVEPAAKFAMTSPYVTQEQFDRVFPDTPPPVAGEAQQMKCTSCGRPYRPQTAIAPYAARGPLFGTQWTSSACECGGNTFSNAPVAAIAAGGSKL